MNRDSANKLWPIIKAFGEGRSINCGNIVYDKPDDFVEFAAEPHLYGVVPGPKYRAFKNAEEFAPNMDRWVINKNNQIGQSRIVWFNDKGVKIASFERLFGYGELFDALVFADDGSPCGIIDTE